MNINAQEILSLIENRHTNDVFVAECKDGPSGNGYCRLDAWAMAKSWAHPKTTGYEIKINRQDWLKDQKYIDYKNYCNELYLVCPVGVIMPEEVPPDVGLLYIAKTKSRLFTKKKAPYREVQIPESLYRYILMCRTQITCSTMYYHAPSKENFWRHWLNRRHDDADFGHMVGRKLGELIKKQIEEVKSQNRILEAKIKSYEDVKTLLKVLGIGEDWFSRLPDMVEEKIKKIRELYPKRLMSHIEELERELQYFKEHIEQWQGRKTNDD